MTDAHYGHRTAPQLRAAAASDALVVVPLGCTEQHGHHLPVDSDSFQVSELALRAAGRAASSGVDVLVLPVLPFGPASEHAGFPGHVSLSNETWVVVVKEIVRSLVHTGFRRVVFLSGCGGHWAARGALWDAKEAAEQQGKPLILRILDVDVDWHAALASLGVTDGGHAAVAETALCLGLRPELVDTAHMVAPVVGDIETRYKEDGEVFLFKEITDTGGLADPTKATPELGRDLWEITATRLADRFCRWAASDRDRLPHTEGSS